MPSIKDVPSFVNLDSEIAHQVYERHREKLEALKDDELKVVNLDITSAVKTAYGFEPKVQTLRVQIVKDVPSFDISNVDNLRDAATTLLHADAVYIGATKPAAAPLQELLQYVQSSKDILLDDITPLANRGLLPKDQLATIRGMTGYRGTAEGVLALVNIVRPKIDALQGKTSITREQLDTTEIAAKQLIESVGERDASPEVIAEYALNRKRAFTYFMKTYDAVRRIVIYIRWNEGDADEYLPSAYAGRGNGRDQSDTQTPSTEVPAPAPVTPAPATAAAPATTPPAASATPNAPHSPNLNPFGKE